MFENYKKWTDAQISERYQDMIKFSNKSIEKEGGVNCYTCEECRHVEKYLYRDTGTTPFITKCSRCGGHAQSSFRRDIAPCLDPTMEWFRPSLQEILKLKRSGKFHLLEHYLNGGLESRPLGEELEVPIVEITVSPALEKKLLQDLNLEIEALQGERVPLNNGQVRITMTPNIEKADLMLKLVLKMIAGKPNLN